MTQHACTWRSIHAAGARRSQATGSSFGMNSRASQRADELAGADPANRAPLAHPRQLAGRSRPKIRLRGARFGDGLETDRLNGRPGGREATRCAVRPLRGAGEPSLLAPRLDSVYTGSPTGKNTVVVEPRSGENSARGKKGRKETFRRVEAPQALELRGWYGTLKNAPSETHDGRLSTSLCLAQNPAGAAQGRSFGAVQRRGCLKCGWGNPRA